MQESNVMQERWPAAITEKDHGKQKKLISPTYKYGVCFKYIVIVLPGLIDHQYAKFAARYGILVDSAILTVNLLNVVN